MSTINVSGHRVMITHENTILFPESGITKLQLVEYYVHMAPFIIAHIKNRPISMQRFPEGIAYEGFYHKDAPEYFPAFIKRCTAAKQEGGFVHYVVCNNAATLAYLANHACIVLHAWLSKIDKLNYPDRMIFDLDPSGRSFKDVCAAALMLREILADHKLTSFVMATGSRGLHVVVPIIRNHDFSFIRTAAQIIAHKLVQKNSRLLTTEVHKDKRKNKIFVDTLRNAFGQTGVAPYSLRARPRAPVACPLEWDELGTTLRASDTYTINTIIKRLATVGDIWEHIDDHKNRLTMPPY